jgi:hypothetical protein
MTPPIRRLGLALALGLSLFAACSKKADSPSAKSQPAFATVSGAPAGNAPGPSAANPTAPAEHRKVIRTGSVRIAIETYDDARAKLDAILAKAGGYVDSTQVNRGTNAITDATIVIRLPSDKFGDTMQSLRELGEISSETTGADDITAQYIDVDARLASSRALEKRLIELASERNGTIDSVLAVEKELARVRGEIEGYEGRLRNWDDHVAMSTLTLTLSTKTPEIVASTSFTGRISNAFHTSVGALRESAGWFVLTLVTLLPWLLVLVPVALVGRRLAVKLRV